MEKLKIRTAAATAAADLASVALPAPSDEQGSNGWSYYDTMSGTWVDGDNNGRCYAGDWSNC